MKNILFATSEAVPFIKTGGLADVAGALPKCFDKRYFDVRVILPKYACMKQEWKDKMEYVTHFYMDLGFKTSVDRNHTTAHLGIWRNLHSSPKQSSLCFRSSTSVRM